MKLSAFFVGLLFAAQDLFAASPPATICGNLPGCTANPANVVTTNILPNLAVVGLRIAATGALLMIIWNGLAMIRSTDDGGRTKAKHGIFYALGGLLIAMTAGRLVGYVTTENFGQTNYTDFLYGGIMASAVRIMLTLSNVILGFMVIWSGVRMVLAQGKSDEFTAARMSLFWALVGAVIINASRVIIDIILTAPV